MIRWSACPSRPPDPSRLAQENDGARNRQLHHQLGHDQNGSHHVRDVTFAEDASRIRKNPDIAARLRSFAYNLLRANGCDNIKNARWRAALDLNLVLAMPRLA